MTIRFCDVQKGKIAVGTTLFFSRGNSKTIMAIRLAGGNRMIWSWQDKRRGKTEETGRNGGETRPTRSRKWRRIQVFENGQGRQIPRCKMVRRWGGSRGEGGLSIRSGTFIDAILLVNWIKRSEMKNRGGRLPWRKGRGREQSERKAVRDDYCRGILSGVKMAL